MADLQIKLTIGDLDIFLQGDGDLVYKVFSDIRENGVGNIGKVVSVSRSENDNDNRKDIEVKEEVDTKDIPVPNGTNTTKSRKKVSQNSGQLLKELDLSGRNGAVQSLKDFLTKKNPNSNVQKTATFVYYLENVMKIQEITIDHIFTCYKTMGYRIPNNLQQNLSDTCSSRYGYISRKDSKFSMTVVGNNYIEFDMNEAG